VANEAETEKSSKLALGWICRSYLGMGKYMGGIFLQGDDDSQITITSHVKTPPCSFLLAFENDEKFIIVEHRRFPYHSPAGFDDWE
jgi:hypothetical protein